MTDRLNPGSPDDRWLQVTYTSADDSSGGRGGWGVKTASPGLSRQTLKMLEREFKTTLDEVEPTPAFAPAGVLERRPRRMVYRLVDDQVCLWHAAAAGNDATGRPGNVFNHAAVLPGPGGLVRPIEMWRSPDLLAPFGPTPVAEARLSPVLRPGTAVTRETVTSFIDSNDRIYALEWLLAAVDHAFRQGLSLLLTVPTPDEGALWMGAISYATSAPHSRQLGFVTYERRTGLDRTDGTQFGVVFLPPGEITSDDAGPNRLLLDPSQDLDDSDPSTWAGPHGQRFPASKAWQDGVLNVYANGARTVDLLALIDEVSAGMHDGEATTVPLEWPLLTALLSDPGSGVANRESRLVSCLLDAPASALTNPYLRRLVDEVTADDTLRNEMLARAAVGSGLWQELQERAAVDFLAGGWRAAAGVPQGRNFDAGTYRAAAIAAVHDAVDDIAGPEDAAMAAGRLIGFVLDHGLTGDPVVELDSATEVAAEALVGRVLSASRGIPRARWAELGNTLHGLLTEEAPADPATPVTPPAPPPTPLRLTKTAPQHYAPPVHQPSLGTAPDGVAPPMSDPIPLGQDDRAEPVPHQDQPTPEAVPEVVHRLRALLRTVLPDDVVRGAAIGDAILVARGIEQVPLLGGEPGIRARSDRVKEVFDVRAVRDVPAQERDAALRWLAGYYALGEADQLEDDTHPWAPVLAERFAEQFQSQPEPALHAIRLILEQGRVDVAASVFYACAQRTAMPASTSALLQLGLGPGGDDRLGWTGVRAAWPHLPVARRADVVAHAMPRMIRELTGLGGPGWAQIQDRIEQLGTATAFGQHQPGKG